MALVVGPSVFGAAEVVGRGATVVGRGVGQHSKAAILYLHVSPSQRGGKNSWPAWLPLVERSAAANRDVTFYFVGAPRWEPLCTANCFDVALNQSTLAARVRDHLLGGVEPAWAAVPRLSLRNKLCDLKPMWPALFPELVAKHDWIGVADNDLIFGNLTDEVAALPGRGNNNNNNNNNNKNKNKNKNADDDDLSLVVPMQWHPQPLANGNFMLYRTTEMMVRAYEASRDWRVAAEAPTLRSFDEWHGTDPEGLFMAALLEMSLNGRLRSQGTKRLLVQDIVGLKNDSLDLFRGVTAHFDWVDGALFATYDGPCVCPHDSVPQFSISQCAQCVNRPGERLPEIRVRRHLEVLGLHFISMKHHIRRQDVPRRACARHAGFRLTPAGFGAHFTCLNRDGSLVLVRPSSPSPGRRLADRASTNITRRR